MLAISAYIHKSTYQSLSRLIAERGQACTTSCSTDKLMVGHLSKTEPIPYNTTINSALE
jgi:hypothetical protein